ncbi:MAG: hypothetical protein GX121_07305 [Ignavibacteria bacterium]|nr:hypothetical protein [Ignavibacteria bacterium]
MKTNTLKVKLNRLIRNYVDLTKRDIRKRILANPVKGVDSKRYPQSEYLLGIIYEPYQYHQHFVKACIQLKISFDVIDLHSNEWLEDIQKQNYDGVLIWPNGTNEYLKMVYDSRLKLITEVLNIPIFPDYNAIWLYENKIRGYDWLHANGFPTVKTHVYFNKEKALKHLETHSLPFVIKTNLGASGKGVYIIKTKSDFNKIVRKSFTHGLRSSSTSPFAESRGYIFIQEFLENIIEWRMVRIGDAFFGHQKLMDDGTHKHSGSLLKGWERPPYELVDLLYSITEKGSFKSMNADVFATPDGSFYVNELHTVFGQSTQELMRVDGKPGRYKRENEKWVFEEGDFVPGHSAAARINYFLSTLK